MHPKLEQFLDPKNQTLHDIESTPITPLEILHTVDVALPVLHGTYGEDGSIQGLIRLAGLPYVGSGVLASAICMDKVVTKRLLNQAGLTTAKYIAFSNQSAKNISFQEAIRKLGSPLFIKPTNQGSSVAVAKVETEDEYNAAVRNAFS